MYCKILIREKWFPQGFVGIAIYPFIILKSKDSLEDKTVILHEKIHLRQQAELLFVLFFIWYIIEFLLRLIQLKDKMKAYRAISFEKEAYENQSDFEYLRNRKFGAFLKYL